MRRNIFKNKISQKNLFCEEIEEKSEKEESQEDISISSQRIIYKKVYNIKPNTQNIFYFDIKTRKILNNYPLNILNKINQY